MEHTAAAESIQNPEPEIFVSKWGAYRLINMVRETAHQKNVFARVLSAEQSMDSNYMRIEDRRALSNVQITNILSDGQELIQNVRKANDRREINRRNAEEKQRVKLITDLERESVDAAEKLDEIALLWRQLDEGKDPKELFDGLLFQEKRIRSLMEQKSVIIDELQVALRMANEQYYSDQTKQELDIECLIGRIDEQIEVMKEVYREHLELLHESIDAERVTFKQFHTLRWSETFDECEQVDLQRIKNDRVAQAEYDREEAQLRLQYEELNRDTCIKLDSDNDLLLRKVQKIKAETMLKAEQLDYNHYVLRKRAAENVFIRNRQKHRLSKLKQCLVMIQAKSNESKRSRTVEVDRLTREVMHLFVNCQEIRNKANLFTETNDKKFLNVWELNELDFMQKIDKVQLIDRVVHETHLSIEWKAYDRMQLKREDLNSVKTANAILREQCGEDIKTLCEIRKSSELPTDENLVSSIFYSITADIVNQTQWLLEEKLDELLEPVDEHQRHLVHVDNVLAALGIGNIECISKLRDFFLPHTECLQCGMRLVTSDCPSTCDLNASHAFALSRSSILPILQQFLAGINSASSDDAARNGRSVDTERADKYANCFSRILNSSDINQFWQSYANCLSAENQMIWNMVESGLNEYLAVLRRRKQLNDECNAIRRQNEELKHLLKQYKQSRLE